ncbi:glutathione S-transferase family protein [Lichenihabitans sp. Uapishka_5]|uniref:glutathione S-transferase family protein n=1 Tax=Lichenihabitans sp. Uapishka_5 TaxID=3037302 RepID=UPI0029E7F9DE|nr:glutathione S-transferase family protein [Lichenihabitans sp. Uapishka_5]MDX7950755.1 glutathione S-transferase family protein [Lichenihabitans sp. Uapishka_5]
MKFYWGPHTCAIGIHVLLEEIGTPYESEKLDVEGGDTHKPPFTTINPKGKVPIIVRDDGSVLTEFSAIALWLARTNPNKGLLPSDPDGEARALEILEYAVGTVHGQGFGRIFKPADFEPPDVVHQSLGLGQSGTKAKGREMVEAGFKILDRQVASGAEGDPMGIADAALFYVERWAPQVDIALPPALAGHLARMKARPAVRRVMTIWGEA